MQITAVLTKREIENHDTLSKLVEPGKICVM